jgi:Tfp pilus assembly protein PilO
MKNIIILILIVAFVVILFLFDLPIYNEVTYLRNEIKTYKDFLEEKEELVIKVNQLKQIYESRKGELSKVHYVLSFEKDIPNLIVQLEALTSENGLILENLAFIEKKIEQKGKVEWGREGATPISGVKPKEAHKSLGVTLSLTGSYQSLKSFLKALEFNVRLMDIKSISFSIPEVKGETKEMASIFTFDIQLDVYYQ